MGMSELIQWLMAGLTALVAKYPISMAIITVMGTLRAVFKPAMSLWRTFVVSTPSPKDDAVLDKVEGSKAMKIVMYVLDWVASIKFPAK